jgi:hypothetical protein
MAPTERWRKGDLDPRTDCKRDSSRWILRSRLETTASLEAHVKNVLDQLDMNRAPFRQLSVEFNGVMQLVAYFYKDYPGLSFEPKLIERMAEYSLRMDCDFHDLQSERREGSWFCDSGK